MINLLQLKKQHSNPQRGAINYSILVSICLIFILLGVFVYKVQYVMQKGHIAHLERLGSQFKASTMALRAKWYANGSRDSYLSVDDFFVEFNSYGWPIALQNTKKLMPNPKVKGVISRQQCQGLWNVLLADQLKHTEFFDLKQIHADEQSKQSRLKVKQHDGECNYYTFKHDNNFVINYNPLNNGVTWSSNNEE